VKSLTAVLHARVIEADIRQSAKGRDYLSLKAEPVEEKTAAKVGAIWVTSFHKSHMTAGIKPGMQIRVEGPLDVQRYEKDGEQRITLWLTADGITLAVEAGNGPLADAQAAGKKADSRSYRATKPLAKMESASSASDPIIGSAITASRSEEVTCEAKQFAHPASDMADGQGSIFATRSDMQDGSAINVFGPKNDQKWSREKLAEMAFPAEKRVGKRHERPFDDALPF